MLDKSGRNAVRFCSLSRFIVGEGEAPAEPFGVWSRRSATLHGEKVVTSCVEGCALSHLKTFRGRDGARPSNPIAGRARLPPSRFARLRSLYDWSHSFSNEASLRWLC